MSMRRFITLVEGLEEPSVLLEAQNYEQMFAALLKIDTELQELDDSIPSFRNRIETGIASAKKVLRKNDRVVWYLRWLRYYITLMMATNWSTVFVQTDNERVAQLSIELSNLKKRYEQELIQLWREKVGAGGIRPELALSSLEHYLSLPIPAIQNTVFSNQTPDQILSRFRQIEQRWIQEQNQLFPRDGAAGEEVIMSFPEDWYWVNLNKAACDNESKAMGHCGNSPRASTQDRILSLRRLINRGDVPHWRPSLTFILGEDGLLGEMKGRGNDKPAERYHSYILALLTLKKPDGEWYIRGIKGGGYMPENNFSISDLPTEDQEKLFEVRPEFATADYLYRKEGLTDRTKEAIKNDLAERLYYEQPEGEWNGDYLVFESWPDWQKFVDRHGNDEAQRYLKHIDDVDDLVYTSEPSASEIENFLDDLPRETIERIGNTLVSEYDLQTEESDDDDEDFEDFDDIFDPTSTREIARVLDDNSSDEIAMVVNTAIRTGYESGAQKALTDAYEKAFDDLNRDLRYLEVVFDNSNNSFMWDTKLILRGSAEKLIKLLSDSEELSEMAYHGLLGEHKLDLGNVDLNEYDDNAAVDTFFDMIGDEYDARPTFRRAVDKMNDAQKRLEARLLYALVEPYNFKHAKHKVQVIDRLSGSELDHYLYTMRDKFRNGRYSRDISRIPERIRKVLLKQD